VNPHRFPDDSTRPRTGESTVIWTLWLTYGAFYFGRVNISATIPGLTAAVADGGLGIGPETVGWILGSLKITYAVGQLLNGQLSERLPARKMLAVGMLGSAALCVAFGAGTAAYFLLFVWAMNGYCQSLGWTPCVRVMANWIPVTRRGKVIGIVGTGYQVMAALAVILAGYSAELWGWRGAMFVPAGVLAACSIVMFLFLKEHPDDVAAARTAAVATAANASATPFSEIFRVTVTNPALWLLGVSLGLLNACRYGYSDWGLAHLSEVQETGLGASALQLAVLPAGAVAGVYLSGWATDRFFDNRRAPVICVLLVLLGVMTLFYDAMVRTSVTGTVVMLVLIGFCTFGPQVLLVGTAPADLARRGTSAAAAGFVNFMGYIGAALAGDVMTGYLYVRYGWEVAIYAWAACAFVAAIAAGLLWNRRSER
jgi:sugar phosphate permease|tara:strand:- start:7627 stop:8904 length:1278 start_codon:yes stop_codon:yes gene_type:complete